MRFYPPTYADRIIKYFAFLPARCMTGETRWLETVKVRLRWIDAECGWQIVEFIDL